MSAMKLTFLKKALIAKKYKQKRFINCLGYFAFFSFFILSGGGCEQYDPSSFRKQLSLEKKASKVSVLQLNEDGTMIQYQDPSKTENELTGIDLKYQSYCASCHGADGKADSDTAMAMNPKPRNLSDSQWQASVDDAYIAKVIKKGGVSVGLSATMAPWGAVLSDGELDEMVAKVRSFSQ